MTYCHVTTTVDRRGVGERVFEPGGSGRADTVSSTRSNLGKPIQIGVSLRPSGPSEGLIQASWKLVSAQRTDGSGERISVTPERLSNFWQGNRSDSGWIAHLRAPIIMFRCVPFWG